MRRSLYVTVLLLVVYLLVQNSECKNNGTQEHLIVDGIDVDKLSEGELYGLLDAKDDKFIGQLDIWIGKQVLKERNRIKRVPPVVVAVATRVAWVAGKKIMKSLIKNTIPLIKKSKKGITKIYFKKGVYRSAKKDFYSFEPTDVKPFTGKNGQEGYTGKILDGKYQITVRKTSTHAMEKTNGKIVRYGRPTLEIRSNTGGKVVRKLRYENSRSYHANKKTYKYRNGSRRTRVGNRRSGSRSWTRRRASRRSGTRSRNWWIRSARRRSGSRSWSRRRASRRSGTRSRNWWIRSARRRSGSRSWTRRRASRRSGTRSRNWWIRSARRRSGSRSWTRRSARRRSGQRSWTIRSARRRSGSRSWTISSARRRSGTRSRNWWIRSARRRSGSRFSSRSSG